MEFAWNLFALLRYGIYRSPAFTGGLSFSRRSVQAIWPQSRINPDGLLRKSKATTFVIAQDQGGASLEKLNEE